MAGKHSVLEDGSRLSRLDRKLYKIEQVFALMSGLAVFSLMVFAVISVGGRSLFNQPLPGYVDVIEQVMSFIAFLGISYCQRDGVHIRMDMLVGNLKGRVLWGAELLSTIAIAILIALLIWGSWAHFLRSIDFSMPLWSSDSSIDIGIPIWPTKLIVPVAFSVLLARLVIQIIGFWRAFTLNTARPVAVPLVMDVVTQAAMEIDHLGGDAGTPANKKKSKLSKGRKS